MKIRTLLAFVITCWLGQSEARRMMRYFPSCVFHLEKKVVYCSYVSSRNFPAKIITHQTKTEKFTTLDLYGGEIRRLTRNDFPNLDMLSTLHMTDMMLEEVDNDAFREVPELKRIVFSHNELRQLNGSMFRQTSKLNYFEISHNTPQTCSFQLFREASNLVEIVIRNTTLTMGDRCFANLASLKILRITYCGLATFDSKLLLDTPDITILDLQGNKLSRITFRFDIIYLPQLEIINLKLNNLGNVLKVTKNFFTGVPNLCILDLGYQDCTCTTLGTCGENPVCRRDLELDNSIFKDLHNITALSFQGSKLKVLAGAFEKNKKLQVIDFRNALLMDWDRDSITHLPALLEVRTEGMRVDCSCSFMWLWVLLNYGDKDKLTYGFQKPNPFDLNKQVSCHLRGLGLKGEPSNKFCAKHICTIPGHGCDNSGGRCVTGTPDGNYSCECKTGFAGTGFKCDADSVWEKWGPWQRCNATCGANALQKRFRECNVIGPLSRPCPGEDQESKPCRGKPCPQDGQWTNWGPWETCSRFCGPGRKRRIRNCTNPSPKYLGDYCKGDYQMFNSCQIKPCRIDGEWSSWGSWSSCSVTCGIGKEYRFRKCDNPSPKFKGFPCPESNKDVQLCQMKQCPTDGRWSKWGSWQACSVTCGTGTRMRSRMCDNPLPKDGGRHCMGLSRIEEPCTMPPCKVDGKWSGWGSWSVCSVTCGNGTKMRLRHCNNPSPEFGGSQCQGSHTSKMKCSDKACEVDGKWSAWSPWSNCSKSCGTGITQRSRKCDSPKPNGGENCFGKDLDYQFCMEKICPVDGQWTAWEPWTHCTKDCIGGTRKRERKCLEPPPSYDGKQCVGNKTEEESCNNNPCKYDGQWGAWGNWSACSVTCSHGSRKRVRLCNNPKPEGGGKNCIGHSEEPEHCEMGGCPVDGKWAPWEQWSGCSRKCDVGNRTRIRLCKNPPPLFRGKKCSGEPSQTEPCIEQSCPGSNCTSKNSKLYCKCQNGYREDGGTCKDIDECTASNVTSVCSDNQQCQNTEGSYKCICREGYRKMITDKSCHDIDECGINMMDCPRDSSCVNTIGSYYCNCSAGYQKDKDGNCEDIDECATGKTRCGTFGKCYNTRGSYFCTCADGSELVNKVCQDINECSSTRTNECDGSAECTNNPGSYSCTCKSGYFGDGFQCRKITKCDEKGLNCNLNATCVNMYGVLSCWCPQHYKGDGIKTCAKTQRESRVSMITKRQFYHAVSSLGEMKRKNDPRFYLLIVLLVLIILISIAYIIIPVKQKGGHPEGYQLLPTTSDNQLFMGKKTKHKKRKVTVADTKSARSQGKGPKSGASIQNEDASIADASIMDQDQSIMDASAMDPDASVIEESRIDASAVTDVSASAVSGASAVSETSAVSGASAVSETSAVSDVSAVSDASAVTDASAADESAMDQTSAVDESAVGDESVADESSFQDTSRINN